MRPERPYRALRAIVGVAIIAAFLAYWLHAQLAGEQVDTLWHGAFLLLLVAAAIAVFGKDTVDQGLEAAQEIRGEGDDEGE